MIVILSFFLLSTATNAQNPEAYVDNDTGQTTGDVDRGQSVGDNDTGQGVGDNDTGQGGGDNDTGASKPPAKPASGDNGIFTLKNPLKVDSIGELIQSFIQIFTYLVIMFAVLMFIWIGFQYVVNASQGNAKKIEELHRQLLWLIAGVAIVIGARVLIQVVINTLSATGTVDPGVINSANDALQGR